MKADEFMEVLDLIKNPTKYEALVKELVTREQNIQASIKQLDVVGDVVKAQQKADANITRSEALIAQAQVQAEALLQGAQTAFDKRNAELKAKEVVADQAVADLRGFLTQRQERDNLFRTEQRAYELAKAQFDKEKEELKTKQAEVDDRLAKLRKAMG